MAVLPNERMNMVAWSRKYHRGKVLPEVELLVEDNQILMDGQHMMCNNGLSHLYSLVTSMPTVSKTRYNEGTSPSHSTSAQETDSTTMFTGLSEVDADLAEVGGGGGAIRAKEDVRFAEVMKQEVTKLAFYGNRGANLLDFDGFKERYNSLSGPKQKNTFSAGGSTPNAQTSVYGAVWGSNLYWVFPEGTHAGYTKQDLGTYPKTLASGKTLVVKATKHKWNIGLIQEDWRTAGRICNIDVATSLTLASPNDPSSLTGLLHQMLRLKQRLDRMPGNRVMYCNDTVGVLLMRLAMERSSAAVTMREAATQFGTKTNELHFYDYPIRRCDEILDTEPVVS